MTHEAEIYLFTNCEKSGISGPTQEEADNYYKTSNVKVSIIGSGIQKWEVPYNGYYNIEAAGASGGSSCTSNVGGKGAQYSSIFHLHKGDILYILIGQQGKIPTSSWGVF